MIDVGRFTTGERPAPLVYTFQDAAGTPIDLTGFSASFVSSDLTGTAVITDPAAGEVTHDWVDADMTVGLHKARVWVGNGSNRYASDLLVWLCETAHAASIPSL